MVKTSLVTCWFSLVLVFCVILYYQVLSTGKIKQISTGHIPWNVNWLLTSKRASNSTSQKIDRSDKSWQGKVVVRNRVNKSDVEPVNISLVPVPLQEIAGSPLPPIMISYCLYPQQIRMGDPVLGGEYMARTFPPLIFPERTIHLIQCYAIPEQLPKGIDSASEEGLRLLGMLDAHIRFCSYGSSAVLKATLFKLKERKPNRLQMLKVIPSDTNLSSKFVITPRRGVALMFSDRMKVVGPLVVRNNREAWFETVPGVALQFDTKLEKLSIDSFTIHMPYAYESFGRSRWDGGSRTRKVAHHTENFSGHDLKELREQVTRDFSEFNAAEERLKKKYFLSMINSNCGEKVVTALIRNLLGYAVYELLRKPVHNLGFCPKNPNGAVRVGLTEQERAHLGQMFPSGKGNYPTQQIYRHYKFAICFENANVEGYVTEKMVSVYHARTIPIYWGGGNSLNEIINRKAFVHCDLPSNVTDLLKDGVFEKKLCPTKSDAGRTKQCLEALENFVYPLLLDYFKPCVAEIERLDTDDEAYERMLSEPLANVDENNQLKGIWNETRYGEGIRAIYDVMGYEQGPAQLRRILAS